MLAHGAAFACHGRTHVLGPAWEVARAFPQSHVLEDRALGSRECVHRRRAYRIEELATRRAGKATKAHRRVWHPEAGESDLWDRLAEHARHESERIQVGG